MEMPRDQLFCHNHSPDPTAPCFNWLSPLLASTAPCKRHLHRLSLPSCSHASTARLTQPPPSLTWAYLQEKLTTTPHGVSGERFQYPVFLLTIQSTFALATGYLYLLFRTPRGSPLPPLFPSRAIVPPLLLVAFTSALAAPFGYASLAHLDYITFILAKSCKLLPVMALHITVFRKRYPLYKYLVVAAVTAGVAVFTLHSGKRHKAGATSNSTGQTSWGLLLLGINLLFDGLTNSTQDYVFAAFRSYTGPQMMCANNLLGTLLTAGYLVLSPWLVRTGLGDWLGMDVVGGSEGGAGGELASALAFLRRYPRVWADVLGFAACGAVGQVFICEFPPLPPFFFFSLHPRGCHGLTVEI